MLPQWSRQTEHNKDESKRMSALLDKLDKVDFFNRSRSPKYTGDQSRRPGPRVQFEWTADGKPVCGFCKKVGHMQARCKARLRQEFGRTQPQSGQSAADTRQDKDRPGPSRELNVIHTPAQTFGRLDSDSSDDEWLQQLQASSTKIRQY